MRVGYFISNANKTINCIKQNERFNSIDELYNLLLNNGWSELSVFLPKQWDVNNKCSGQCNATVLIVKEYFGGDIIAYPSPTVDKKGHYFNRINNVDIDLTSEQFDPPLTDYSSKTKIATSFGRYDFECKKAAYIVKKNIGL